MLVMRKGETSLSNIAGQKINTTVSLRLLRTSLRAVSQRSSQVGALGPRPRRRLLQSRSSSLQGSIQSSPESSKALIGLRPILPVHHFFLVAGLSRNNLSCYAN